MYGVCSDSSFDWPTGTNKFLLGAFDVLSELWLNIAFIIYRIVPQNHSLLSYIFFSTFSISLSGTIAETIMIFYLLGNSWSRWELSFKIVTPILHVLFTAAQIHAAKILCIMWKKEKTKLARETEEEDLEASSKTKGNAEPEQIVVTRTVSNDGQDSIEALPSTSRSSQGGLDGETQRKVGLFRKIVSGARKFVTGR